MIIRPVAEAEWATVAWLWQAFRADMSAIVHGLPYADGRFSHTPLDAYPAADRAGYLAWAPHPNTGEQAPIGFVLVSGLGAHERVLDHFWVAAPARRGGLGTALARHALEAHDGPWAIPFQHDNHAAAAFWRRVARQCWGEAWVETREPVPGKQVPDDHWIRTA